MPTPLKRLAERIHQRIDRVERHRPEWRKGQVTSVDPLRVDGVRAGNVSGFALTVDDVVWMLVGHGRRQVVGVTSEHDHDARVARVHLSANQSIPHDTSTVIEVDGVDYDEHGLFDAANNRFDLDRAGKWLVVASISYAANGTGGRHCRPEKNGSLAAITKLGASDDTETTVLSTVVVSASSGDTIAMDGLQRSGGALDVVGGSSFWTFLEVAYLGT